MKAPAWPTAELLWFENELYYRVDYNDRVHSYDGWTVSFFVGEMDDPDFSEDTRRFAENAIPVVVLQADLTPAELWEQALPLNRFYSENADMFDRQTIVDD